MTMAQMEKTMETMRSICGPKYKLSDDLIDGSFLVPFSTSAPLDISIIAGLHRGEFDDSNKDLKCYTMCVAQMAGTLTKKSEISYPKTLSQIENLMPAEVKAHSLKVLEVCKNVQNGYKEACDRTFYTAKCIYEFNPEKFLFP